MLIKAACNHSQQLSYSQAGVENTMETNKHDNKHHSGNDNELLLLFLTK